MQAVPGEDEVVTGGFVPHGGYLAPAGRFEDLIEQLGNNKNVS